MTTPEIPLSRSRDSINRAFTKQSGSYDQADRDNPILRDMRKQVYSHVEKNLSANSHILELNAGTGIDALHFLSSGHRVHAIDISDGMIRELEKKHEAFAHGDRFTIQQLSYENINLVNTGSFDYVFSNFGGLNCIQDLSLVTRHLPSLLKPKAYVTFVIMPPVCVWELLSITKGNISHAFRRFRKDGVLAHLEGEYFKMYYHSLASVKQAFEKDFRFVQAEGLAALSPQPHHISLAKKFPRMYTMLRSMDALARHSFPFNRWADHIIVTFQLKPTR